VRVRRGILGPTCIDFKHEGRALSLVVYDEKALVVRLTENVAPKFPCVITTQRRFLFPWALVGLRLLPRVRTFDPLVDEAVALYATPVFASYLRELILDAINLEGKPSGVAESFIVLRRLAGVRRFRLSTAPEGAMTMRLALRTEDVLHRPEELESIVHHMGELYDRFVKY
jgi:hypothetical protein